MAEHAEISPSTYEYRELCEVWEPDRDEDKDTTMADRGTSIHKATETESLSELTDPSDIDCAKLCIKYIRHLKRSISPTPFQEFREFKITVFDQFGWGDNLIVIPSLREGHLVDFKSGFHGVTDAEHNPQIQAYVRGAFNDYPILDDITAHLLLPRRQEVSIHKYTRANDFDRISNRIFNIIERAKRKSRYNPGWKQCQYCGNKAKCEALMSLGKEMAPIYKPDLIIPEPIHPSEMTDGFIINLGLKLAKVLEPWIEAMKKRAKEHCAEGFELADFKTTPVAGSRSVSNAGAAWEVAQKYGITLEEYLACCSATFGDLQDLVAAHAPRGTKGMKKLEFEDSLTDANALTVGAPKLQLRSKTKELT